MLDVSPLLTVTPLSFSSVKALGLAIGAYLFCRLIWKVYLYPLYFSPYLSLPQARQHRSWTGIMLESLIDGNRLLEYLDNTPNEGVFRVLDIFNREVVVLTGPKYIKEILQTNAYDFEKLSATQNFLKFLLGDGLLTVDGQEHKRQRKALNPAFSFRHVQELYPLFWSKSGEMTARIQDDLTATESHSTVDMSNWVNRAALDIIGIAAAGVDFGSLADENNELSRRYQAISAPSTTSTILFLLAILVSPTLTKALPLKRVREIKEDSQYIKKYIADMITKREINSSSTDSKKTSSERKDILSTAAKNGGFTTDELVDQARTFFVAGHETSATSVQWALYTLTRPENLHIQQRLREEIHSSLPNPVASGSTITSQQLDSLVYLDAVSKEAMRMNAPAPFARRYAIRDTQLQGHSIRKGTNFLIPNWAINKSRDLWGEDARVFNPERWFHGPDKLHGGADTLAYQTFSSGTRGCIGKSFAMAEYKALLATLIGSFEISRCDDEKDLVIDWGIIAKIHGGFKVKLKPVVGWV